MKSLFFALLCSLFFGINKTKEKKCEDVHAFSLEQEISEREEKEKEQRKSFLRGKKESLSFSPDALSCIRMDNDKKSY